MNSPVFSLLVLRSSNPDALLPFYNALGLEFQSEQHGSGPIHFSCEIGEVVLEIYPPKKGQTDAEISGPMLGFRVDSLEKTLETLRALGVEIPVIKTADWGRFCNVRDFDGRTVQLSEK
ncbi:MAG TPA: VOC family protein [Abditibacterium sp.]|jgi:catechol 2,3-dioxygenase-like lactoylglutathione lyase family enzyme